MPSSRFLMGVVTWLPPLFVQNTSRKSGCSQLRGINGYNIVSKQKYTMSFILLTLKQNDPEFQFFWKCVRACVCVIICVCFAPTYI